MTGTRRGRRGFTVIEFVILAAILAALAAVAVPKFASLLRKTREGNTKGRLAAMRAALSLYAADHMGKFPTDHLESLTLGGKYLKKGIPAADVPGLHPKTRTVTNNSDLKPPQLEALDNGGWSYWSSPSIKTPGYAWGALWLGCGHTDAQGTLWTLY
ncbi:MAG: hypothetical protein HY924_03875 [Elusimicrobia bacterium]|nr:hypothetical protein [Elusimicrobiota bacterium]